MVVLPGMQPFGKIHHHAITFNVVTHGLRPDIDDADKPPYTNLMRNWCALVTISLSAII
jgi:hypothetical protein